jgi:hypothetical protein
MRLKINPASEKAAIAVESLEAASHVLDLPALILSSAR